jgi:hypothetical protein
MCVPIMDRTVRTCQAPCACGDFPWTDLHDPSCSTSTSSTGFACGRATRTPVPCWNNSCAGSGMPEGNKRKIGRGWKILLVVVLVLVLIRIVLPYILLDQANKRLKSLPDYYGHIDDLDLAILRGAYSVNRVYIDKVDTASDMRSPFIAADAIDLSIEWRALLRGKIVGEIIMDRPMVRFTVDEVEPEEVAQDTFARRDLLDDFMPLKIERFEIRNGSFQFRDPTTSPQVFLAMENIQLRAENLTTVVNDTVLLPSYVTMDAAVYNGRFTLDMELDPLAEEPTFDMAVEVEGVDLSLFNEFFQAYGNFDIQRGTFGMFTELAAKNGRFLGYVKPVISDLQVLGPKDRDKPLGEQIWQGLIGLGGMLLTNPKEDQIATRVPLEGDLSDPNVRTWYAVIDLLRNAFIRALEPQLDHDISIDRVPLGHEDDDRGFFKRLFGGQGPSREERDAQRKQRRANP